MTPQEPIELPPPNYRPIFDDWYDFGRYVKSLQENGQNKGLKIVITVLPAAKKK